MWLFRTDLGSWQKFSVRYNQIISNSILVIGAFLFRCLWAACPPSTRLWVIWLPTIFRQFWSSEFGCACFGIFPYSKDLPSNPKFEAIPVLSANVSQLSTPTPVSTSFISRVLWFYEPHIYTKQPVILVYVSQLWFVSFFTTILYCICFTISSQGVSMVLSYFSNRSNKRPNRNYNRILVLF